MEFIKFDGGKFHKFLASDGTSKMSIASGLVDDKDAIKDVPGILNNQF